MACRSDLMPQEPLENVPACLLRGLPSEGKPTGELACLPAVGGVAEERAPLPSATGACTGLPSDREDALENVLVFPMTE